MWWIEFRNWYEIVIKWHKIPGLVPGSQRKVMEESEQMKSASEIAAQGREGYKS